MRFFVHREKGFNLFEVIVVSAIIALLSTIVLANVSEGRKKGHDTQRKSDIEQIRLALRLYRDAGSVGYPDGTLDSSYDTGVVVDGGSILNTLLVQYLPTTLKDPLAPQADYEYVYDSDFDCAVAGTHKKVLYARIMEQSNVSNWMSICGTMPPAGSNTYGVILQ